MIDSLLACTTCANNFKHGDVNPAGWSILFMLGVILPVLLSVVFFMVRFAMRERNQLEPEYRDEVLRSADPIR